MTAPTAHSRCLQLHPPGNCEVCGSAPWRVVSEPGQPEQLRLCIGCLREGLDLQKATRAEFEAAKTGRNLRHARWVACRCNCLQPKANACRVDGEFCDCHCHRLYEGES